MTCSPTPSRSQYGRGYLPTHRYCGSDSARASVGDPGHCEPCAVVGHVVGYPDYGCADVMCNADDADDLAVIRHVPEGFHLATADSVFVNRVTKQIRLQRTTFSSSEEER